MIVPSESNEQRNLFSWARSMERIVPELGLMYAVPNGGSRRPVEAAIMKAEGVKPGVPDIHLPVRRGHLTLYVELKRKAFALPDKGLAKWGEVSEDQLKWLVNLTVQGHWAVVCRGAEHAKATILAYLNSDQRQLELLNNWWVSIDAKKLRSVTKTPPNRTRKKAINKTRTRRSIK